MSNTQSNQPTRYAYYVAGSGRATRWIKIGAVFPHDDGKGESVLIDAIPVNFNGRITLRDREEKEAADTGNE